MAETVVWSDLHPDMKLGSNGQPQIITNVMAVYGSLDNIFGTIIGERVMLRRFAMNFKSMLFEPINASLLRATFVSEFKRDIETWEPRVKVDFLDITADSDYSTVRVRLDMYVRGYDQIFTFDKEYKI